MYYVTKKNVIRMYYGMDKLIQVVGSKLHSIANHLDSCDTLQPIQSRLLLGLLAASAASGCKLLCIVDEPTTNVVHYTCTQLST